MGDVTYRKKNNEIECVHYQNSRKEFQKGQNNNELIRAIQIFI